MKTAWDDISQATVVRLQEMLCVTWCEANRWCPVRRRSYWDIIWLEKSMQTLS